MKTQLFTCLYTFVFLGFLSQPGNAISGDSDEVIVQLKEHTGRAHVEGIALSNAVAAQLVGKIANHPNLLLIKKRPGSKLEDFIAELKAQEGVMHVEANAQISIPDPYPNQVFEASEAALFIQSGNLPSDPELTWGYENIMADQAGPFPASAPLVAVVDTGVDYTHPELAGRVILGQDFYDNDDDPMDVHGHGTHVSGIIAAEAGNGLGSAGICPTSKILAIKVFGDRGEGTIFDVVQGLYSAADHPDVKIINLSLGTFFDETTLKDAIEYAVQQGKLVTASAGNYDRSDPFFPAFYSQEFDGVMAVSANDQDDCKAWFSNYGYWVDISAPGDGIFSTLPGGMYATWSGTSMASPFVAAAAARLLAENPNLQAHELADVLENSTDALSFDSACWPSDWSDFGHLNLMTAMGYTESPDDLEPPLVGISSPTSESPYKTNQTLLDLTGWASDNDAVQNVTWQNSRGGSGTAEGTETWLIEGILLYEGENLITVTATDQTGNQAQASLKAIYASDFEDIRQLTLQVSDRYDDSFEKINGANYPTYTRTYNGKGYINGFRFQNVAVPSGALIVSAVLEVHCWGFASNDIALQYAGEAADDAAPFTSTKSDLSSRPKTFAAVTDQPAPWEEDAFNEGPDLGDILQEIVNRPGWLSGNAVNLYVLDQGSSENRRVTLFDGTPENAARLVITYKTSGSGGDTDTVAPQVQILAPQVEEVYHTSASNLSLSGTAMDNVAVTAVSWESDRGGQGEAEGTTEWTVSEIPLYEGENTVTVTAWDAEGNHGEAQITVIRDSEGTPVTLELKISEGNNDAWEKTYNGINSTTNKTFYLNEAYTGAFRFTDVPIPAGATITKAVLMIHCRLYNMEGTWLKYTGEKGSDAQPFSGKSFDISSRERTDAEAAERSSMWVKDSYNESADISAIIQEIVNQSLWKSGNALCLFVDAGYRKRLITPFEYNSENAVYLKLEYVQ